MTSGVVQALVVEAPRVATTVVVKRSDPRFLDCYGHWWIEVDGQESYGWWPARCPLRLRDLLLGTAGCLNGLGGAVPGGTPTTDPHHGDFADHRFHPTLVQPKTDAQLAADIRAFAQGYTEAWRWRWWWTRRPTRNCRSFQWELFAAVGLREEPEHLYTQGSGCPFLYPLRAAYWAIADLADAARGRLRNVRSRWVLDPPGGGTADMPGIREPQPAVRAAPVHGLPTRLRAIGMIILMTLVATACASGRDAVSVGGNFTFVAPGGQTTIRYDPPAARGTVRGLSGDSVLKPGRTIGLDDFPGQVVVLNIWGSWCGPCRTEMPELQQVYEQTRASGVTLLGIDVRDNRDAAADFMRDRGITYPSIFDEPGRSLAALRGFPRNTVPATIVLDRDHRVAAVFLTAIRVAQLMPVVQQVAAEPATSEASR